jgi:phage protein D
MGDINNPELLQARPSLLFAGSENEVMAGRLHELLIHENVNGMYRCEALFNNWGAADGGVGYLLFDRSIVDFGKQFEVKLGSTSMFSGKITAIQADYPNGAPPQIRILAEDNLQDLRMTRRTRSFSDLSDAQVIQQIAQGHSLTPQVDISGATHKVLAQINQSDLAFMRERARAVGAEIWVEGQTLHVAKRSQRGGTTINLTHGAGLREFTVLADLAQQATAVYISGWDVGAKEAINEQAGADAISAELGQDESGASILRSAFGERKQTHAHTAPASSSEARDMAAARFRDMARRFVVGNGVAEPDPRLRVGIKVLLSGLGPLFSGKYYVTETNVTFDGQRGLRTNFRCERPGLGRT